MSDGSRLSTTTTAAAASRGPPRRMDLPFFRGPRFDYDEKERRCWCKPSMRAPMWLSWTDSNPGRRFFNCPNEPGDEQCLFFEWLNDPFSPRAVEVINGLRREKALYRNQLRRLMNDGCDNCRVRITTLGDVIVALKAVLNDREVRLGQQKRKLVCLTLILCLVFVNFILVR